MSGVVWQKKRKEGGVRRGNEREGGREGGDRQGDGGGSKKKRAITSVFGKCSKCYCKVEKRREADRG